KNRQMRLQFICNSRVNNYPDKEESVSEDGCTYTIRIPSALGCPLQNPNAFAITVHFFFFDELFIYKKKKKKKKKKGKRKNRKKKKKKQHTIQNAMIGKFGDDCTADQDPDVKTEVKVDDSGYVAGLVVLIILLVLTIGILAYLFVRFRKSMDPTKQTKVKLNDEEEDADTQEQDNKL
ncbi:hypothetical protein RFI_18079, partial [Reticulomyxa filosa]